MIRSKKKYPKQRVHPKKNLIFFFVMLPILALTIFTLSQPTFFRQFAAEKAPEQESRVLVQSCDMAGTNQCPQGGTCNAYGAGRAGFCQTVPFLPKPANPVINPAKPAKAPPPPKAAPRVIGGTMPVEYPEPKYHSSPLTRENSPIKNAFKVSCAKDILLVIGGFCTPNNAPSPAPKPQGKPQIVPPNYQLTAPPTLPPTATPNLQQPVDPRL